MEKPEYSVHEVLYEHLLSIVEDGRVKTVVESAPHIAAVAKIMQNAELLVAMQKIVDGLTGDDPTDAVFDFVNLVAGIIEEQ